MKVVYDWIQEYVGSAMPDVTTFEQLFTFHAFEIDGIETIDGKTVIDVKVLPDRAGDCLSHLGIARELGTLMDVKLAHDVFMEERVLTPVVDMVKVSIEDSEQCRRFSTALITNVVVGPSPTWLKERLQALHQRSINNVVDATNYVMLALGQPLHAYDGEKFEAKDGIWHFGVRMARVGEEVTILGGEEKKLAPQVQIITNAHTDTPVGIAGIKGGASAEITEKTTTVILEAANFNPQITRKGAQEVKLQTDALKRFENNISPESIPYALMECVKIIEEIAGGTLVGYSDIYPTKDTNPLVSVRREKMQSLLGVTMSDDAVEDIFTRLHFVWKKTDAGWDITAPFYRRDILIPEDVIAEVGRVYGYEKVESVLPEKCETSEINIRHYYSEKIRETLVDLGFSEVITSSFRKKDEIELQNAFASDKGCLRSSLYANIKEVLERNIPHKDLLGTTTISVFEIGTVFYKKDDDVAEHTALAFGVRTKQEGGTAKDTVRVLEVLQHLESVLGITCNGVEKDGIYEVALSGLLPKLSLPTHYNTFTPKPDTVFVPYSLYPCIARDIALWVPTSVLPGEVETMIREKGGELLIKISLFDEFKKEERTSYAFRLIFQSFERTLTDEEVGGIMDSIYTTLKEKGFEIR